MFNQAAPAFKEIRARRRREARQTGKGLASDLAKIGLKLGLKALGSEIGKKIINMGIDNIPNIFKFAASKIKTKTLGTPCNHK